MMRGLGWHRPAETDAVPVIPDGVIWGSYGKNGHALFPHSDKESPCPPQNGAPSSPASAPLP